MFRQFLVVFVFQNGVFSLHNDVRILPASTFLNLISKVIETEKKNNVRYENIKNNNRPIDLDYYDFNLNNYHKKHEEDERPNDVRIHVIKNPEVVQRYQKLLLHKRHSSEEKENYLTKIFGSLTLEDIISHLRRNAAYRADEDPRQRSNNLNSDTKEKNKYDDQPPKIENDDWNKTPKKYNDNKRENKSAEKSRDSGIDWNSKKEVDNYLPKEKKHIEDSKESYKESKPSKSFDTYKSDKDSYKPIKSDSYKPYKPDNKDSYNPIKSDSYKPNKPDNNKDSYNPIKSDSYKPFKPDTYKPYKSDSYKPYKSDSYKPYKSDSYKPYKSDSYKPYKSDNKINKKPKLSEDFKPNYKPYDTEKKESYKQIKPAHIDTEYRPRKKVADTYQYRPRDKKIERSGFGRTPIPYMGHRGVYDEK